MLKKKPENIPALYQESKVTRLDWTKDNAKCEKRIQDVWNVFKNICAEHATNGLQLSKMMMARALWAAIEPYVSFNSLRETEEGISFMVKRKEIPYKLKFLELLGFIGAPIPEHPYKNVLFSITMEEVMKHL